MTPSLDAQHSLETRYETKYFLILAFWLSSSESSKYAHPALAQWCPQIPWLAFLSVLALGHSKPSDRQSITFIPATMFTLWNSGRWVMDTDALHSLTRAYFPVFCGQVNGKVVLCVLLLWVIGQWPRFALLSCWSGPIEQLAGLRGKAASVGKKPWDLLYVSHLSIQFPQTMKWPL